MFRLVFILPKAASNVNEQLKYSVEATSSHLPDDLPTIKHRSTGP